MRKQDARPARPMPTLEQMCFPPPRVGNPPKNKSATPAPTAVTKKTKVETPLPDMRHAPATQSGRLGFFNKKDDVETPPELYAALCKKFKFDFDPCPLHSTFDGLAMRWGQTNWCNPPFSKTAEFVRKAIEERDKHGAETLMLITVHSNADYWQNIILRHAHNVYLTGKITFVGYDKPFPAATVLVHFRPGTPENVKEYFGPVSYYKMAFAHAVPTAYQQFLAAYHKSRFAKDRHRHEWGQIVYNWMLANANAGYSPEYIARLADDTWMLPVTERDNEDRHLPAIYGARVENESVETLLKEERLDDFMREEVYKTDVV